MSIAWQRLTYGTLAAAGLATTGALIYWTTRIQVHPEDVIELIEGYNERCFPFALGEPVEGVVTNLVELWTNDTSGLQYPIPQGTNAPLWTNYLASATNTQDLYTNSFPALSISPGFLEWKLHYREQVGRFVWAGWDEITVSGVPTEGIDGTFAFTERTPMVSYYTNGGTSCYLSDHGYYSGWRIYTAVGSTNTLPSQWFMPYLLEWSGSQTPFWKPWGSYHLIVCAPVGSINSNHLADAPAMEQRSRPCAVGKVVERGLIAALETNLLALIPRYVDSVDTNNAVSYCSVTGLFARLFIGDGTNQFSRMPPPATNNQYGAIPLQIMKERLTEYYKLLHALSNTVMSPSWDTSWSFSTTNNLGYNEATYVCLTNAVTNSTPPVDWWVVAEPPFSAYWWWNVGPVQSRFFAWQSTGLTESTNGMEPEKRYWWDYDFGRGQKVYWHTMGPEDTWTGEWRQVETWTNVVDQDISTYAECDRWLSLPYMPTSTTVNVSFYGRLNYNWGGTYYPTGSWYILAATSTTYSGTGSCAVLVQPPSDIGLITAWVSNTLYNASYLGNTWPGELSVPDCGTFYTKWAGYYVSAEGAGIILSPGPDPISTNAWSPYYNNFGRKITGGNALLNWQFSRCTNAL